MVSFAVAFGWTPREFEDLWCEELWPFVDHMEQQAELVEERAEAMKAGHGKGKGKRKRRGKKMTGQPAKNFLFGRE